MSYLSGWRLTALHELAKRQPRFGDAEREIAVRMVREAQREREEWARQRHGSQPVPYA